MRELAGPHAASAARAAALAITIALSGCGGSGHAGTQPTAPQPSGHQASGRSAPSPGTVQTVPTSARGGQASGIATKTMTLRSFQTLASTACQAASSGVPPATRGLGQGPRGGALAAYEARRHAAIIQQTIATLSRLRPPASLQARVARLMGALWRLQELYIAGSRQGGADGAYGTPSGLIAAAEREAAYDASAAGLPACALTGPGQLTGPGRPTAPSQPTVPAQPTAPGPQRGGRLP
jgi:hypothetical protein